MEESEFQIWSVSYDGKDYVEVLAVDDREALRKTEPRDSAGKRTWKKALAVNVTPQVPSICPLE